MKYKLTENFKVNAFGVKLFQIECVTEIKSKRIRVGDLGGWIEAEKNLSQEGDSWVFDNAQVFGSAKVYGNAWVYGNAKVYGNAEVHGSAQVFGDARVFGSDWVYGNAEVHGSAEKEEKGINLDSFSNEDLLTELNKRLK
jgi:predicted acyltransferase (DUF342 family)